MQLHTFPALFTLITLGLISGCASQLAPEGTEKKFRTRITDAGLKHFELRLVRQQPKQATAPLNNRQASAQSKHNKRLAMLKKTDKVLRNELQVSLEQSRYCREGHWIIEQHNYGNSPFIRGECNETASTEDYTRFPDTLHEW